MKSKAYTWKKFKNKLIRLEISLVSRMKGNIHAFIFTPRVACEKKFDFYCIWNLNFLQQNLGLCQISGNKIWSLTRFWDKINQFVRFIKTLKWIPNINISQRPSQPFYFIFYQWKTVEHFNFDQFQVVFWTTSDFLCSVKILKTEKKFTLEFLKTPILIVTSFSLYWFSFWK